MRQLREEDGVESDGDNESKWEGWDIETDSSESSDDGAWIDVDSDKDIVVSDSDDEDGKEEKEPQASQPPRQSILATTKVGMSPANLNTDADFIQDPDACRFCLAKRATYQRGSKSCTINRWQQSQTQTRRIRGFKESAQFRTK